MNLFWRHEGDGVCGGARIRESLSSYGAGFVEPVTVEQVNVSRHFCPTEVQYLYVSALRHEDIGGLDIAMHDAYGVYRVQGVGHLNS